MSASQPTEARASIGSIGLTTDEARQRLAHDGPNELAMEPPRSPLRILLRTLRQPLFLLLVGATALYLAVGDLGEGLFMAASAVISIGLVVVQETRSERAIAALKAMANRSAKVLRDGQAASVPTSEIVCGDALVLRPGDRIAADAHLVDGAGLTVDEAMLTGESVPVAKISAVLADVAMEAVHEGPSDAATASLYAGTIVTSGEGVALVTRTGLATELGRIGQLLVNVEPERSRLERAMGRAVLILSVLALLFCGMITVAYGLIRDAWLDGALAGITLAIALVPEEFPMVLSVFMTLGAWRLARRQVLARRSAVIEALGSATVLCVDKTGTLTANDMTLVSCWTASGEGAAAKIDATEPRQAALLRAAGLACDMQGNDPMDRAVLALSSPDPARRALRTHSPTSSTPYLFQVWPSSDRGLEIAVKGAPEAVLALCRIEGAEAERVLAETVSMASQGFRVLAVALSNPDSGIEMLDDGLSSMSPPVLLGLLGFIDPVREEVPEAVARCRRAGIRVVMITGDYPTTATTIARQAGIEQTHDVLTGDALSSDTPDELVRHVRDVDVYARIRPEQKLAIVRALQATGAVVAMTGDGVNDAPALKAAEIGIAMGLRGTDLARESADIVLLDDRFSSIVAAVAMGRRIFANLRRALVYITAIHVPIAGLAAMPLVFGLPPMLLPMHVVLMEMVIDPLCSIAFEAEAGEEGAMQRPPMAAGEPLFAWRQLFYGLLQGGLLLTVTAGSYVLLLRQGMAEDWTRTFAYVVLTFGNLTLAFCSLDWSWSRETWRNRWPLAVVASATGGAILVIVYLPLFNKIFRTTTLDAQQLGAGLLLAALAGGGIALPAKLLRGISRRGPFLLESRPS